jgi:branched-chain amino acid transport system substrate-binding protein
MIQRRWFAAIAVACACASLAAAASSSLASSHATARPASVFGAPHKATGTPYVFGMINDETGAVTFPEARQGAIAAENYVNDYLDGINGHPIAIDECEGDGTPATAARCANEIVAKHPVAILGAADVGGPASIPIYAHAGLAYLGGIPFTPVPFTAKNSVQFWSVSVGDNMASAVYIGKVLKVKHIAIMYFDNPQGASLLPQIEPTLKNAGVTDITTIPLSPTSADPSPQAALVESSGAQAVYVDIPNGCGAVLKALSSVGFTGKVLGIDPCSAPPVLAAGGAGANGMQIASPFYLQTGSNPQAVLFRAALAKWAAKGTFIDSISSAGFATVINVRNALSTISGKLTTAKILAAFRTGSNHPNFMSHPYTCNGEQMDGAPAICNDYYLFDKVVNGVLSQPNTSSWTTSKGYYKGYGL